MHRSFSLKWIPALGLVAVLVPAAAHASVLGQWTLQMNATLEGEEAPCAFQGTASLTATPPDSEFGFTGPGHLNLVSGPQSCPSSLDGTVSVNVDGTPNGLVVNGQIDGGEALGLASFTGLVVGDPMATGTFAITGGPFSGLEGSWSGTLAAAVVLIPTLRTAGLVLLAALLALASVLTLRRRSGSAPTG
jgi:hypothetical protein